MAMHNSKPSRNWSKYTEALVNRGKLTLFITKDFADTWYIEYDKDTPRARGGQAKYSEAAITSLLSLRFRWMQVVNASWLSFLRPSKFQKGY
jgi:hypothetical protein